MTVIQFAYSAIGAFIAIGIAALVWRAIKRTIRDFRRDRIRERAECTSERIPERAVTTITHGDHVARVG